VHPDDPEQYRIPPAPSGYAVPSVPPAYGPPLGYGPPPGYPPYAAPGYPPPGYPVQPYAAAPWNAPRTTTTWPYGPGRPGIATAAAVLGFVTGGLTAVASFFCLMAVLFGGGDLPTIILVLGLPCAAGLIRGGVLLLRRDSTNVLSASAVLSVVVLLFTLLAGFLSDDHGETVGITLFVVLAAVLPIVTACLAVSGTVRGWMESLD
jgi:hypothetical protein